MMIKELSHASAILSMVASFLERWNISTYQRESIQVFYLLLKVWNFLTLGQVFCITHHEILSVLLWKKYLLGRLIPASKMLCFSNEKAPTHGKITPLTPFAM